MHANYYMLYIFYNKISIMFNIKTYKKHSIYLVVNVNINLHIIIITFAKNKKKLISIKLNRINLRIIFNIFIYIVVYFI